MSGILEAVKVVSMGQIVAIPAASSVMADWGADVIKLEPLTGEMHRGLRTAQGAETAGRINWIIQVLNRNSRGLAIDLKQQRLSWVSTVRRFFSNSAITAMTSAS